MGGYLEGDVGKRDPEKTGKSRKISVIGEIDYANYVHFSSRLELLQKSKGPVTIELFSEGGDVHSALAFYDKIKESPNKIIVSGYGLIASAAVLILAAGDVRRMGASAWVMVHEDQGSPEGSVSEIEKAARQLRRMEDQWNVLMAKCTNLTEDSWAKLHNATTYLTPEDCLSAGLIDEIIEARK